MPTRSELPRGSVSRNIDAVIEDAIKISPMAIMQPAIRRRFFISNLLNVFRGTL